MERSNIIYARLKYLMEIKMNRECSNIRPENYLDKTWINQNVCTEKCWTNAGGSGGPKLKSGKGGRYIIHHGDKNQDFIPGALLMVKSKRK